MSTFLASRQHIKTLTEMNISWMAKERITSITTVMLNFSQKDLTWLLAAPLHCWRYRWLYDASIFVLTKDTHQSAGTRSTLALNALFRLTRSFTSEHSIWLVKTRTFFLSFSGFCVQHCTWRFCYGQKILICYFVALSREILYWYINPCSNAALKNITVY